MTYDLKLHATMMRRFMKTLLSENEECKKLRKDGANPANVTRFHELLEFEEKSLESMHSLANGLMPMAEKIMELSKKANELVQQSKKDPSKIDELHKLFEEMEKIVGHHGFFG